MMGYWFRLFAFVIAVTDVTSMNVGTGLDDKFRIIGGGPVDPGELKYQLSIRAFGSHSCGASLVIVDDVQVAITAAHCLMLRLPEQLTLVGGTLRRNGSELHQQTRQVVDFNAHEDFDLIRGPLNDIAVMFIDKPFEVNQYVGPISLPKAGQETRGRVVMSGWGLHKAKIDQNEYGLKPSDMLNKVEVPVLNFTDCEKSYSRLLKEFSDHFMCTGFQEEWSTLYKGACIGDSGGPVRSVNGDLLVGVISFGKGCKDTSYPAVNMKVSHFIDWINDNVRRYKKGGSSEEDSKEDSAASRLKRRENNVITV